MPQKVSARYMSAAERVCTSFSMAGTINAASAPARKMSPQSSASAKPLKWRANLARGRRKTSLPPRQTRAGLLDLIPQIRVNGIHALRTPNTTNIMFAGLEGEALVIALDLKGLACSIGAACSSGAVEPSHVLTAIGLVPEEAKSSLRFSLGRHTTESEINFALDVIPAAVAQLRALSPTYRKEAASHV